MGIRKYKPTSPSRRFMTGSDFEEVTSTTPEKSLLDKISKTGGRNNNGRVTSRQLGKIRRVGRHAGRRPDWKKAYVTLAEGSQIDFFEGA